MTACTLTPARRKLCKFLLFFWALLLAYSRVYLGDHYPLDVAAGALVGTGCGLAAWKFYSLVESWFRRLMGKSRSR